MSVHACVLFWQVWELNPGPGILATEPPLTPGLVSVVLVNPGLNGKPEVTNDLVWF